MLRKLDGRTTCLAFDDFESDPLPVRNGIDQGCPLSVIYYLIYNSPLSTSRSRTHLNSV
ncbi:hypothetical protein BDV93DRAFT_570444 [Ceratobasidium sp. AG-I]|nr:hypothetical protein BDV93DRAFT_570444 [Ceratobasidium sp. AG-I]